MLEDAYCCTAIIICSRLLLHAEVKAPVPRRRRALRCPASYSVMCTVLGGIKKFIHIPLYKAGPFAARLRIA